MFLQADPNRSRLETKEGQDTSIEDALDQNCEPPPGEAMLSISAEFFGNLFDQVSIHDCHSHRTQAAKQKLMT
eukprot:CAMPEP_0204384198 /NCGR_PEP_ID=MMETSP0469-20131031/56662_1 /ASSEMBLY_ACC=CAM_ASM_000384 /TAXON_ID=2969 /ORGANISM="Oxyrrhis marina" /LENGTH=72 /DNA_ID=CAMNT_0051376755 /DNA_START=451 /DNA_END=665 /DNA_ORIENTATION=+